ncbi:MAG: molecular chaperone HtpG [Magnetovibrionaceae bacterium]
MTTETVDKPVEGTEQFTFQAEVSKLLDIVAHSLYSQREVFLRELISNASDACDKLRYRALTEEGLSPEGGYQVTLSVAKKAKQLSIADNGIGMNREDLIETLGTIARSGTGAFLEQLKEKGEQGDLSLIGQFGVGFYSAFMVADTVEVVTRKAGEEAAWKWTSDGSGSFTIEPSDRDHPGTTVTLTLKKDAKEFLEDARITHVIEQYSDHIDIPVMLAGGDIDGDGDGDGGAKQLNTASALWTRKSKDVTEDQYKEFYHHVAHAFDEPFLTMHNQVEGVLSYTNLLFIPTMPPHDLFDLERKAKLKLYVNKVFITDDCEGLLPRWLRFVKGVVDSEDLSLNVSREMLQNDPQLAKIAKGLTKRVLNELKKKADKDAEGYAAFWDGFGAVIKEGLYEDQDNREKILGLCRFRTTRDDAPITIDQYVEGMVEGQEAIYYISGDDPEKAAKSPHLEGFKARGINVLILTDPVDEFWVPQIGSHAEKPFKSVTQGGADLSAIKKADDEADKAEEPTPDAAETDKLIAAIKLVLGDAVKDVRASDRLTDSPCCLVAGDGDMDLRLERMMKQAGRVDVASLRVFEVNAGHPVWKKLASQAIEAGEGSDFSEAVQLLLDQARIVEGDPVADPTAFGRRLARFVEKGLAG